MEELAKNSQELIIEGARLIFKGRWGVPPSGRGVPGDLLDILVVYPIVPETPRCRGAPRAGKESPLAPAPLGPAVDP